MIYRLLLMNRKKRINYKLKKNLKNFEYFIEDNSYIHKGHNNFDGEKETHILIKLKPRKKMKYNRLSIHRLINKVLEEEFTNGLHSLEIKIID